MPKNTSKFNKPLALALILGGVASTPAFAQAAQPDVTEVVAYVLASIATIALVGNARLMVGVATSVFRWVRGAAR